ncbi:MAG: PAS domain S-box protein, partial [Gemmatimonadales bacterium]|nr:PAS domain S-box protein [Gemmatimonadales bacterium]
MPSRRAKPPTKKRRKRDPGTRAASRNQLERLLTNLDEVTYEVVTPGDPLTGKTVYVSCQVEALVGHTPEEFLRDSSLWFHLLHPDDLESVIEVTRTMYERRRPCSRLYRLRHKTTGAYRWIEDRIVPRLNGEARVVGYYGAARDVTDRISADEQLRFQSDILRNVQDNVIATDLEGRITYWNEGVTAIFGYGPEEMLGKTAAILYPDQDPRALAADLERVLQGTDFLGEWLRRRKDGSPVWVDAKTNVLRGRDGRPTGFLGVAKDVTERRRAEQALRESEERYRTLFETATDAVYITTRSGRLLDANDAAAELWGGPREELLRLNVTELYADPRDRERFVEEIERQGVVRNLEIRARHRDGTVRDCLVSGSARRAADGTVVGYQGVAHDITGRKRAEDMVRASRDRLRALAVELHSVYEADRTAIAREIHDEFGQALTGLKMDLTWLVDRCASGPKEVPERLGTMLELVDRSVEAVRRLAAHLRPAVLDDLGIAAAIEWLSEDFAKHSGIECGCDVPSAEPPLGPDRATAVFRIAQEALTNVARHSGARHVEIAFTATDEGIGLEVRDDGKGITEDQVASVRSIGLIG